MAEFHFLRPAWLLLLVPLAFLAWRSRRSWLGAGAWIGYVEPRLREHVIVGRARGRDAWSPVHLLALAAAISVIALAGPVWERLPQPVFNDPGALVIVLDLSESMDAADVNPTRLGRARFKVADLLDRRRTGVTALVVYAGDAFTVTPLTDDVETIKAMLPSLSTAIMPTPGSRADIAVERARTLLRNASVVRGEVLLITDGVTPREIRGLEPLAGDAAVRMHVLGIGTETGAPVPQGGAGFRHDAGGKLIVARLDPAALAALARRSAGVYHSVSLDDTDVEAIARALEQRVVADAAAATTFLADQWLERGPWLLLGVLPLAALLFRRGTLAAIGALMIIAAPRPAAALEWEDFWLRPDQRAARAFADGDHARAAELFRDPAWKAAAQYRQGEFESAAETLAPATTARERYNLGNALARQGQYAQALAAYDAALKETPDDPDARYNRDLVAKELERQSQAQGGGDGDSNEQSQGGGDADAARQSRSPPDDGGADSEPGAQNGSERSARPPGAQSNAQSPSARDQGSEPQTDESGSPADAAGGPSPQTNPPDAQQAQGQEPDESAATALSDDAVRPDSEQLQAAEQWLRRIPDDPGGLLRRKFRYQYQERKRQPEVDQTW